VLIVSTFAISEIYYCEESGVFTNSDFNSTASENSADTKDSVEHGIEHLAKLNTQLWINSRSSVTCFVKIQFAN
jgi:hypothetical protein